MYMMDKFDLIKEKIKKTTRKTEFFLLVFILISSLLNTAWIVLDQYTPIGDADYLDAMVYNNLPLSKSIKRLYVDTRINEPPLMEILMSFYYRIFGLTTKNELVINTLFLIILLISVYKIGEHMYNKQIGILSSIFINSFCIIIIISKRAAREFPLLSILALTFWMLLKTDYFRDRKFSLLFGLALGLTSLVKYSFIVYVLPMSLYIIYSLKFVYNNFYNKKHKKISKKILTNIFIALIIFFIISLSWYLVHFLGVFNEMKYRLYEDPTEAGKLDLDLLSNITYHYKAMLNYNIGFLFTILFTLGIIYKFLNKSKFEEKLLITTFMIPYLFFIFMPIKAIYHLVPIYFVIPIITTEFIFKLKKLRLSLFIILLLFSVLNIITPFSYKLNTYNLAFEDNTFKILNSQGISYEIFRELVSYSNEISISEKVINKIKFNNSKGNILYISSNFKNSQNLFYLISIYNLAYLNTYSISNKPLNELRIRPYTNTLSELDHILLIRNKTVDYVVVFFPRGVSDYDEYKYSYLGLLEINRTEYYYKIDDIYGASTDRQYAELYKLRN